MASDAHELKDADEEAETISAEENQRPAVRLSEARVSSRQGMERMSAWERLALELEQHQGESHVAILQGTP
ncbi:MAG: hypothetical protein KDD69_20310, partial [Bdellovibrionales bacterium]|nr:hypothetical protein [Bdellovibrionales bacterium]